MHKNIIFERTSSFIQKPKAVTVACHVIPASGRLVDVDIPKLSESPWPGSDIF